MNRFQNQVCLVTGSTKGIGLGIAKRLAEEGGIVHICSRKKKNVDKAVSELKSKGYNVFGHICNVGKKEQRIAMLKEIEKQHGRLDVLVPNAACSLHVGQ